MSAHPTPRRWRAALSAAGAVALLVPAGAIAGPPDHTPPGQAKKDRQGACTRDKANLPPGLAKREQLPPGLAKREQLPPGLCNENANRGENKHDQRSAAPAPAAAPTITLPSSQRVCVSRRYFRIRLGRSKNVRSARVTLDGRRITIRRGRRYVTALIDLRRRVKGTYVVRITVRTKRGNRVRKTRRFRTCTARR